MMTPARKDLQIRFGDTHKIFFRVYERVLNEATGVYVKGDPKDLTNVEISAQVKRSADEVSPLLEYVVTKGDQADLALGRGSVLLECGAADTAGLRALSPQPLSGVWDCQFTEDSDVFTYIEGTVTFSKDVTR
jgi:hypothetical protein